MKSQYLDLSQVHYVGEQGLLTPWFIKRGCFPASGFPVYSRAVKN
ncbi:hypothetical protein MGMO_56c00060 [Methyloglobulus morosus KoM1]|uniref:Uncharacterized protein n=1 Tax=Methyloglobulus morosus KoM1 TaxID=1116472 RepID=V5DYS3_9GAMM|nr:hypothetical protein MGMO_56c00060 [Methyloglobulus morosus KoM1]